MNPATARNKKTTPVTKAGGRHAAFRLLRAFFLWYEDEVEPQGWSNPIRKVKAPKVPTEPLEPVSFETINQMVKACPHNTLTGDRDTAILLCLLDTGARANEFLSVNLEDINQARGDILIRQGKGHKPRTVYIGKQSKKALRRYLNKRKDNCSALWVTHPRCGSERLLYNGLRAVLTRRAKEASVEAPSLHDFRRAFALAMLRNGTDIFTLAQLSRDELIDLVLAAEPAQVETLQVLVAQVKADNEALRLKLEKGKKPPTNSSNSSQPPSLDHKPS